MARGKKDEIDHIIKRLYKITEKSYILKTRNPRLALSELPTSKVEELKEVVVGLVRAHKAVLRLATARGPRVKGEGSPANRKRKGPEDYEMNNEY